ncbi:Hsp20/alpha crystallin family protein [Nitrospira sp. Kam-Ns4a]
MAKEAEKTKETLVPVEKKPAAGFSRWEEFDRWFDRLTEEFWRPFPVAWRPEQWLPFRGLGLRMPPLDVYEDKDDVVIKAELPGLKKEDIEVSLTDHTITIKGEKKRESEVKDEDYLRCERAYGAFARTVALPCEIKPEAVKASFKDGVLEVRLPKTEAAKKKAITVKIE